MIIPFILGSLYGAAGMTYTSFLIGSRLDKNYNWLDIIAVFSFWPLWAVVSLLH